jgi:DNA-binding response OmpR family regulator
VQPHEARIEIGIRGADPVTKRVLIADDEPNIVISLEFLMSRAGFEVSSVSSGDAVLAALRRNRADVLLLDVMLPVCDGFEVCRMIRRDPSLADLKIVMLTARGRDAEVREGLALGADAYVTKPFATRELLEFVITLAGGD